MPKKTSFKPKDIAVYAADWSLGDLAEMRAIIDALVEATQPNEAPTNVEQPNASTAKAGRKGGDGYYETKMINGSGPYRYLRYMRDGKRKSLYMGKAT